MQDMDGDAHELQRLEERPADSVTLFGGVDINDRYLGVVEDFDVGLRVELTLVHIIHEKGLWTDRHGEIDSWALI